MGENRPQKEDRKVVKWNPLDFDRFMKNYQSF